MNEEEEIKEEWRKSMQAFNSMSDGFWVIGYRNGGNERFAFGIAEDPVIKDALFLPQMAAMHWTENNASDLNEGDR
jgi:hypothetical protein